MPRHGLALAFVTALAAWPAVAQDMPPLLSALSPEAAQAANLDPAGIARLQSLAANPAHSGLEVGRTDPQSFRAARGFALVLPAEGGREGGRRVVLENMEVEATSPTEFVMTTPALGDIMATIAVSGQDVLGSIRVSGTLYNLRPVGDGITAIYHVDTASRQQHPEGFDHGALSAEARPRPAIAPMPEAESTIRLLVIYTTAAKQKAETGGRIDLLIKQALADANKTVENNRLAVRFELAGAAEVAYREDGRPWIDLERFRETADGHMDEIHAARDKLEADIGILISIDKGDRLCGLASGIGSDPKSAFAMVNPICLDNFTLIHEIGHLMFAQHNPEAPVMPNPPYAYGHGKCNMTAGWRTVMSYNTDRKCGTGLPAFSTPKLGVNGVAIGDADKRDNSRVIGEVAATIAAFRGGEGAATPPAPSEPPAATVAAPVATPAVSAPSSGPIGLDDMSNFGVGTDRHGSGQSAGGAASTGQILLDLE
ncbi:MAG: M12 family metallo-peptidase [Paracoccaceae bacterium]